MDELLITVIWPHFAHRVTLRRGLGFGSGQWQALPGSAIRGFEPGGVRAGMGLAPKLLWVWIQKKSGENFGASSIAQTLYYQSF
jgi:hypothetical protein